MSKILLGIDISHKAILLFSDSSKMRSRRERRGMVNKHQSYDLAQMQSLPLKAKVRMSCQRIDGWYNEYDGQIFVSFSGGIDSRVLAHLVREVCGYKDVPLVFVNTGLEYPEIVQFVKSFENVVILRPKMNFRQVIEKYGYPFFSKETSEAIFYARKYLKRLKELESLDRQTERQTDR